MDKKAEIIKAETLIIVAGALLEGAAGPCGYWYKVLAQRLSDRAKKIVEAIK